MTAEDSPLPNRCSKLLLYAIVALACIAFTGMAGCGSAEKPIDEGEQLLSLSSPAFSDNRQIPAKYTCYGEDISPELDWADVPAATKSLVLIFDDPDSTVGLLNHWIVFNIGPDVTQLLEDAAGRSQLPPGALQGKNGLGVIGYVGPCPPNEPPHHYTFTIYALDAFPNLRDGASKSKVVSAMQGHVLGYGRLIGVFQKP